MTPKARARRQPELRIPLDGEDLADLHAFAKASGLAGSQFARSIILNFLNRARAQTSETDR